MNWYRICWILSLVRPDYDNNDLAVLVHLNLGHCYACCGDCLHSPSHISLPKDARPPTHWTRPRKKPPGLKLRESCVDPNRHRDLGAGCPHFVGHLHRANRTFGRLSSPISRMEPIGAGRRPQAEMIGQRLVDVLFGAVVARHRYPPLLKNRTHCGCSHSPPWS
jgi:hypothetical protein